MRKSSLRVGLCGLLLMGYSFTQADEPSLPKHNGWATRPEGKYRFLQQPYKNEDSIRKSLPFRRIKLEHIAPGGFSLTRKGFPAVHYYIEFHADGSALLHTTSGTKRNGIYQGKIDLTDYARLCLLYETLINEAGDPARFGHEINSSHPVISELTVTFRENQPARKHRNDVNFGDFKFWVFENVVENIESKVEWKKVEE